LEDNEYLDQILDGFLKAKLEDEAEGGLNSTYSTRRKKVSGGMFKGEEEEEGVGSAHSDGEDGGETDDAAGEEEEEEDVESYLAERGLIKKVCRLLLQLPPPLLLVHSPFSIVSCSYFTT